MNITEFSDICSLKVSDIKLVSIFKLFEFLRGVRIMKNLERFMKNCNYVRKINQTFMTKILKKKTTNSKNLETGHNFISEVAS